jgi:hypothetical protein
MGFCWRLLLTWLVCCWCGGCVDGAGAAAVRLLFITMFVLQTSGLYNH